MFSYTVSKLMHFFETQCISSVMDWAWLEHAENNTIQFAVVKF